MFELLACYSRECLYVLVMQGCQLTWSVTGTGVSPGVGWEGSHQGNLSEVEMWECRVLHSTLFGHYTNLCSTVNCTPPIILLIIHYRELSQFLSKFQLLTVPSLICALSQPSSSSSSLIIFSSLLS